jgi:hypothetical protein
MPANFGGMQIIAEEIIIMEKVAIYIKLRLTLA